MVFEIGIESEHGLSIQCENNTENLGELVVSGVSWTNHGNHVIARAHDDNFNQPLLEYRIHRRRQTGHERVC